MQVSPNNHSGPVSQNRWPTLPQAPGGAGQDTAQFNHAAALNRSLADAPDARAAEVERARQLITDANYPAATTIRRISLLLASNLNDSSGTA